jgi:hypothetical protein
MIKYHTDLIQGSDEWRDARCGLLTASEMHLIITPTLKVADNDKTRAHLWELLSQRITRHVEPSYIGDNILRGWDDELLARELYHKHYAPVEQVGFVTNDRWGFTLGYSPDGLVGDAGLIECKSRKQRLQIQTIADFVPDNGVMPEYVMQVQTGLLVSEREWCDHISYSGGLPMVTVRIYPDEGIQAAILDAARAFEKKVAEKWMKYTDALAASRRLLPTGRRIEQEIHA